MVNPGGTGKPGRAEFVAVIDADAPGVDGPVVEWSIPVEIPARILAELAGDGDTSAVVVRNGIVLYAPGELDLGRSTRLANRAQRRALRGLYATCAIPGCTVAYDRCELHHVIWWRHGGRTDVPDEVEPAEGGSTGLPEQRLHMHNRSGQVGGDNRPARPREVFQPRRTARGGRYRLRRGRRSSFRGGGR